LVNFEHNKAQMRKEKMLSGIELLISFNKNIVGNNIA